MAFNNTTIGPTLFNATTMSGTTTSVTFFEVTRTQTSFMAFGLALTMALTLTGNIFVLLVLDRQRSIKNSQVTNMFLANLATVDLIMAAFVLPISISVNLKQKWIFGDAFCDFNGMLTVFVGAASILTMAAISIDRHQAIVAAQGKRLTVKQALVIIIGIWVWSLLIGLLPVIGWSYYTWALGSNVCKFSFVKDVGFVMFLVFSCFLVPLLTMIICYSRVFLRLRRHQKQLAKWDKGTPSKTNNARQAVHMRRERRATFIVCVVLLVFVVCWVPFVILSMIKLMKPTAAIPSGFYLFSSWCTTAHAAGNPIIYVLLNRKFRTELARIMPFARGFLAKVGTVEEDRTEMDTRHPYTVK